MLGKKTSNDGFDFEPVPTSDDDLPPIPPTRPAGGAAAAVPIPPAEPLECIASWGDGRHQLARHPVVLPVTLKGVGPRLYDAMIAGNRIAEAGGVDAFGRSRKVVGTLLPQSDLERVTRLAPKLEVDQARELIKPLGLVSASLHRQCEISLGADKARRVVNAVPGLTDALLSLGDAAQLPPRDSEWTNWLGKPEFSFLGVDDESVYGEGVRTANAAVGAVNQQLLPGLTGEGWRMFGPALGSAAEDLSRLTIELPARLARISDRRFCNFLADYEVNGLVHRAPDPMATEEWRGARRAIALYCRRADANRFAARLRDWLGTVHQARCAYDLINRYRGEVSRLNADEIALGAVTALAQALITFQAVLTMKRQPAPWDVVSPMPGRF